MFKDGYLDPVEEQTITKVLADLKENFTDKTQT